MWLTVDECEASEENRENSTGERRKTKKERIENASEEKTLTYLMCFLPRGTLL